MIDQIPYPARPRCPTTIGIVINRVPTCASRERIPNSVLLPIATASFPWEAGTPAPAPISFEVCNVLNVEALNQDARLIEWRTARLSRTSLVTYRNEIQLVNNDDSGWQNTAQPQSL